MKAQESRQRNVGPGIKTRNSCLEGDVLERWTLSQGKAGYIMKIRRGGDMGEDRNPLQKLFIERCGIVDGKQRRRTSVIAKLVGARCEVEDVLLSSSGSTVLSAQERVRLSNLMGAIDNIVRRIEKF